MDHEIDEAILKFEKIAERRIKDAIDAGEFDNLEGYGKPLKDEDNPYTPKEMKAALKVLSNSGYAPDWMVLAGQIDADIAAIRHAADRHFAYLRRRLQQASTDPYAIKTLREEVAHLKSQHRRASAAHTQAVEEINRKINSFNQMVPIASLVRIPLSQKVEMERFEDRLPAFLSY